MGHIYLLQGQVYKKDHDYQVWEIAAYSNQSTAEYIKRRLTQLQREATFLLERECKSPYDVVVDLDQETHQPAVHVDGLYEGYVITRLDEIHRSVFYLDEEAAFKLYKCEWTVKRVEFES